MSLFSKRLISIAGALIGNLIATIGIAHADQHAIDELSWLNGHWIDTRNPEKQIEVRWDALGGDAMIGTWRRNNGAKLAYYEILTMREIDGEVYYRFDLYSKHRETNIFEETSSTRLKLLEARSNHAVFHVVGEENWILTMDVEDDVLRGWMEDTNNPKGDRNYSYVAKRQ